MKLNQLALATIALIGASQAFAAAPTQYLTGASASSLNVMKAARNLCAANGGAFSLYKVDATPKSLGNVATGVCSTGLLGATSYTTVAINVAGGSASAVTGTTTNTAFLLPVAACTTLAGTEALDTGSFGAYTLYTCPSASNAGKVPDATDTDTQVSDGGFLDVEGPVFPSTVLDPALYTSTDFKLAGFSQAFGVGVNTALYTALQTAQIAGAQINGVPLPAMAASCLGQFTAACQPTISKAQIASLINNAKTNNAKTAGGKFLVGGTSDVNQIVYCMRPQTSGTQQSAELYFLNYGAAGNVLGGTETIINNGVAYNGTSGTAKFAATLNSGSSDVKTCLNAQTTAAGTGTGYRFGILSLENNPLGLTSTDTFRFVKLNGVAGAQGAGANDSNTATALTGEYDFVFETVGYGVGGVLPAVVSAIQSNLSTALPVGSSTAGLFLGKGVETKYSRGSGTTPASAAPYITRY